MERSNKANIGKTAKGINMVNVIQVETGEKVQAMLHFREMEDKPLYLFMTCLLYTSRCV